MVVRFIGWTVILCIVGSMLQKWLGAAPPEWFKEIAIFFGGALASFLTRTGTESVRIDNPTSDPVQTEIVDAPKEEAEPVVQDPAWQGVRHEGKKDKK